MLQARFFPSKKRYKFHRIYFFYYVKCGNFPRKNASRYLWLLKEKLRVTLKYISGFSGTTKECLSRYLCVLKEKLGVTLKYISGTTKLYEMFY